MSKHVLVALSWGIDNIGSMAITPGLLHMMDRQRPEVPARIISLMDEDDPKYAVSRDYIPLYKSNSKVLPNRFRPLFQEHSSSRAWSAFKARWGEQKLESFRRGVLSSHEAEAIAEDVLDRLPLDVYAELREGDPAYGEAFDDAGFVIYNSGTMINFGRLGVRNMWGYTIPNVMPLLIARALKLPYGLNSNSFDAIDWPADLIFRPLLEDARFVYCRDSDSLNYLRQCDLTNASTGYRPDSAFFFQGRDEAWAERYLADNGLEEKQFLAVIVRISGNPRDIAYDPTGGSMPPERIASHMGKIKEVIERWIAATGMKVLLCHETRDTVESARTALWDQLSADTKRHCVFLDHFWSSEQACSVIRRTRVLLSMEMHSVIMSIGIGTPVVHNPFDEAGRKKQMVRDVGLGDWLVDIDASSAEAMADRALAIHRDYEQAERRVHGVLPGLEARAFQTLSEVWTHWRA
ncbi:polysaccharide pyruvyl transferase family protein [Paenibacillus cymbidii]|uniref:polysaccharide pyruvyl transferase family protein n=1 Tax=Paenibacillus cymbidii TaxID=1639034 RepID=UPI0010801794|nr:polysaccharide pyruvyl transferase family protein [Paenibacillus cymbidii]